MADTISDMPDNITPVSLLPRDATGAPPISTSGAEIPLIIDLDGTLLRTDVLIECVLAFVRRHPLGILQILFWGLQGRAFLKQQLARRVQLDVSVLPLNLSVMDYAVREKARGRKIYLATAADRSLAESISERCGCFDEVLASDGRVNLRGEHKLNVLRRHFPTGFGYVGDSQADMVVWQHATEVVLVGSASWTRRTARRFAQPTLGFTTPSRLRAFLKCGRPHQWAKNMLVFAPAILSGEIRHPNVVLATALSFVALSLVASATYIVNDLWDLMDDRRHWSKCHRPIASGKLPITTALAATPVLLVMGLLLGLLSGPVGSLVLLCYVALTLSYSFFLKRVPVLDVTMLAGLFTLRLVLGAASAHVIASPWLLVFSMFLFTSLSFAKRYVEVARSSVAPNSSTIASRGYRLSDHTLVFTMGVTAGTASIVVMVFYIIFDAFNQTFFYNTEWLWAFPLILYLWLARIWLLAMRGELDDDPVAFAVRDMPSLVLGGGMSVSFLLAWLGRL
jgi:4-hydroxybenzoate polyprenyltransferase